MGPLRGQGRFSSLEDEEGFLWMLETLQAQPHAVRPTPASPLEHVLRTYESAQITGEAVARKLEASPARHFAFPDTALGEQLRTAARLLDAERRNIEHYGYGIKGFTLSMIATALRGLLLRRAKSA